MTKLRTGWGPVSNRRPSVLFIPEVFHGGYRLRSLWPAQALHARGWNARVMFPNWDPKARADVVVIHRVLGPEKDEMVDHFHATGSRVIISEDDDWWSNAAMTVTESPLYPVAKAAHERAISIADGIIVTTPALAEIYRPKVSSQVSIVRNWLPGWVRGLLPRLRSPGPIRVGWRGTIGGHRRDVAWIRDGASSMLDGSTLVSIGEPELATYWSHAGEFEPHGYITDDARKLYRLMATADLAIVPLATTRFNDSKSWLAALEWSSVGVPVVATATRENVALAEFVPSVMVASDPDSFSRLVKENKAHPGHLQTLGLAGRVAAGRITLESRVSEWEEALDAS